MVLASKKIAVGEGTYLQKTSSVRSPVHVDFQSLVEVIPEHRRQVLGVGDSGRAVRGDEV